MHRFEAAKAPRSPTDTCPIVRIASWSVLYTETLTHACCSKQNSGGDMRDIARPETHQGQRAVRCTTLKFVKFLNRFDEVASDDFQIQPLVFCGQDDLFPSYTPLSLQVTQAYNALIGAQSRHRVHGGRPPGR